MDIESTYLRQRLGEILKPANIVKLSKEYLSKMPKEQLQSEVSNYLKSGS